MEMGQPGGNMQEFHGHLLKVSCNTICNTVWAKGFPEKVSFEEGFVGNKRDGW